MTGETMVKNNVITLNHNAKVVEAARMELIPEVLFQRRSLGDDDLQFAGRGAIVAPHNTVNRALALARERDFLNMCLPILWGDEKKEHIERFGWLLRGAVETFKPLTVFELALVKNVVACQWRLDRLLVTQANVFEHEARRGEIGKYGLPAAVHVANELDEAIYEAQETLLTAIATYRAAVKAALDGNKER